MNEPAIIAHGVPVHRWRRLSSLFSRRTLLLSFLFSILAATGFAQQVVINEIMYHPYQPYPVVTNTTSYIEIYNTSATTAADLSIYRFDNGVTYDFTNGATLAPTSFAVICEDIVAFTSAYPTVQNWIGQYSGSLKHGGERVTLSIKTNDMWVTNCSIQYYSYNNSAGGGPSLELVNPGFACLKDECWGAWLDSTTTNGTPGRSNSVYNANPPPAAGNTEHAPALPFSNSVVTITANAASFITSAVPSVTLFWRADATPTNAWTQTAMYDNGSNGDAVASDRIFTVRVPPYGTPGFASGTIMEFKIAVKDTNNNQTTTIPFTNTAGVSGADVTNYSLSYLCYFGEDTNYTGEYDTYHILMTQTNRYYMEHRDPLSPGVQIRTPVDVTVISADGKIFYNSAARYRGDSSSMATFLPGGGCNPYWPTTNGYRVSLPSGMSLHGRSELNLNWCNALSQYLGHRMVDISGHGAHGLRPQLCRVFLNAMELKPGPAPGDDTYDSGMYFIFDTLSEAIKANFSDTTGNNYGANGTQNTGQTSYQGDLTYHANIADYQVPGTGYLISTNNPNTVWTELSNLCWCVNQPTSSVPPFASVITNRMKVKEWASIYATMVVYDNRETGFISPWGQSGDEFRMYCDPSDGLFTIFPWDLSDSFINDGQQAKIWNWNYATIQRFLFNRPTAAYYIGDIWDLIENKLNDHDFAKLVAEEGSAGVAASNNFCNTIIQTRALLRTRINTNLSITVSSQITNNAGTIVVSSSPVTLTGKAPMNYTAKVLVNGVEATWDYYNIGSMPGTYGNWTLPGTLTLAQGENHVLVRAIDDDSNDVQAVTYNIIYRTAQNNQSGTISVNTTWTNSSGVVYVTGSDVVVNPGVTLTIAPNTVVLFDNGRTLTVNGTLNMQGTSANPIYMFPSDCSTTSTYTIQAAASGSIVTGNYVVASGARFTTTAGGALSLVDSSLSDPSQPSAVISAAGGGQITLIRCIISNFLKTTFAGSPVLIDQCLFQQMSDAGAEFSGSTSQTIVRRTTIRNAAGSNAVDGIRYTTSNVGLVTNCYVHDMIGNGVEVGSGAAGVQVCQSLIRDCSGGITILGSAGSCFNNTIEGCTNALIGAPASTYNMLVWGNINSVSNGPATMSYSDIEMSNVTNAYTGTQNINKDPFYRDTGSGDCSVLGISPCLGAGGNGISYIGALPSVTNTVGAEPVAPTALTVTNTGNQVNLTWKDNSSDEKWFEIHRSNGGNTWDNITNLPANTTNFTDTTVQQSKTYYYRVRSAHERGSSFYTDSLLAISGFTPSSADLATYLRITELMYNPSDTNDYHEFIELKNISSSTWLDLSGCYFSAGVGYAFPPGTSLAPGQFYVIGAAGNESYFSNWYPAVTLNGVYTGHLSNGGEKVAIKDSLGATIYSVTYSDAWYPTTDGDGWSLVVADVNGLPDLMSTWRPSTNRRGSPGADDPDPTYGNIVINELIAHSDPPYDDAIEIYNAGTTSVDVAGWYLSNDPNDPSKYRITNATLNVPKNQYRVFYATNSFNKNPANPNCFNLGELGGTIYLSSATNAVLTSFRTAVSYDATENATNGVSFGRYVRSDSNVDYTVLSAPTFGVSNPSSVAQFITGGGATNAYPKVGPIVISEIMYNPPPGGNEFVELYNITNSVVPLFDVSHPSNTWQLAGSADYVFPTNVSVPVNGYVLLVKIDPATFCQMYGLTTSATLQVFGPYNNGLANNNSTVTLYKPGEPQPDGFVPQYRVDHVHYYDSAPWPALADSGETSIERKDCTKYGNDPTNWVAASVGGSPGSSNNVAGTPSVGFTRATDHGVEADEIVDVNVMLLPATNVAVTLNYTVGGTATAGSDYVLSNGSLTFWPNETNKVIRLQIKSDTEVEPDETVVITLSGVSANARLGGYKIFTYTIIDQSTLTGVAAPTITPAGTNIIVGPTPVAMSCVQSGAAIYYTLDGAIPTTSDALYTNGVPITVVNSARVTARAFLGSYNGSASRSSLFLLQNGKIQLANPLNGTAAVTPYSTVATGIVVSASGAVQNVAFWVNGSSIGSRTSPPYTNVLTLTPGVYSVWATMTDQLSTYTSLTAVVTVYASAPSVDAGETSRVVRVQDQIPMSGSVSLNGWDPSQVTIAWSKISGPAGVNFSDMTSPTTYAAFPQSGVYTVRLTVYYGGTSTYDSMTVTAVATNNLSTIPFSDSFEEYGNGTPVLGMNGWYGSGPGPGAAQATNYVYTNTFPITTQHTLVLGIDGSVSNVFTGTTSFTNTWLDLMVECKHWTDVPMPALDPGTQFGICVNTNSRVYVWNCQTSATPTNVWTMLPDFTVANGQWVRFTVDSDYTRDGNGGFQFTLYVNGVQATNPFTSTVWFNSANTNRNYLTQIGAQGYFHIDDVVVTLVSPFGSNYVIQVTPIGRGNITPGPGTVLVSVHSNRGFTFTPSNYSYVADVLLDHSSIGTPGTYTFTNVVSDHTLDVMFGDVMAPSNTPWWWLAQWYPSNQVSNAALNDTDGDGMKGWQEYIAGTIPISATSVFQIVRVTHDASGNQVYWLSSQGRIYSVYKSSDILGAWPSQALTNGLPYDVSGTNNWMDQNYDPRAWYRIGVSVGQ
jgi:hypothetical protein